MLHDPHRGTFKPAAAAIVRTCDGDGRGVEERLRGGERACAPHRRRCKDAREGRGRSDAGVATAGGGGDGERSACPFRCYHVRMKCARGCRPGMRVSRREDRLKAVKRKQVARNSGTGAEAVPRGTVAVDD
jgi:hypothetical protein